MAALALLSFSHVGLCVADLERSTRFYVDVLGFQELFTMDFTGDELAATMERGGAFTSRMLRRDDLRLELLHWHEPVAGDGERRPMDRRGVTHLCFRVDDVLELADLARAAGGQAHPETLSELPGGVRTVYLTDPDGVRVECIAGSPDLARL
ncbi:MAG: VOC family protein [Mycobacteriales bacterium]